MDMSYPDDADGDALQKVVDAGADMSRPMTIDFSVAAPSEAVAKRAFELAGSLGYVPSLSRDSEGGGWSVYCARLMLAT
jgi:hypothetical protein